MPILQNKLVIKSIEALHDEALALMPNTASSAAVSSPTILQSVNTPQDAQINAPEGKSADEQPEAANNHDIMARIDHLLKKLDEDDGVDIAQPLTKCLQPNNENVIGAVSDTVTSIDKTINNSLNPDKPVLSDDVTHVNVSAPLDVASGGTAGVAATKPLDKTGVHAGDDMLADDQQGREATPDQAQALADIATAIYQARRQTFDTVVADANPNNANPFDISELSAAVANEVRRTVSSVMTAELPKMVRDAVSEAIREFPTDTRGQSKSIINNQLTAKNVASRKTAAKKTPTKKAAKKKTPTKKAAKKKTAAKKAAKKKTD